MLVIGLTGGIGSGKSTAARRFESLGIPVIDADDITRELVKPGQDALVEICNHFGSDILLPDGQLDRSKLRERIFNNPDERKLLENILHPRARKIVQHRISLLDAPYCVLSVPLLIESGWTDLVQRILVIDSPREQQILRIINRDGTSREQAAAIIDAQLDPGARLAAADDVINNVGDIPSLVEQVDNLHKKYCQLGG